MNLEDNSDKARICGEKSGSQKKKMVKNVFLLNFDENLIHLWMFSYFSIFSSKNGNK